MMLLDKGILVTWNLEYRTVSVIQKTRVCFSNYHGITLTGIAERQYDTHTYNITNGMDIVCSIGDKIICQVL